MTSEEQQAYRERIAAEIETLAREVRAGCDIDVEREKTTLRIRESGLTGAVRKFELKLRDGRKASVTFEECT